MAIGQYNGGKALYHLDGSTNDSSGNGYNGTPTNITWPGGTIGSGSAGFNGTNSYITISSNTNWDFGASYSITHKCYINSLPTTGNLQTIIYRQNTAGTGPQFELVLYNVGGTQTIFVSQATTFNQISYTLPTGQWIDLTITYGSNTITFYLDGVVIGALTQATQCGTSNKVIDIGRNSVGIRYFDGKIDEVIVENKTLSLSEVKRNFTASKGRFIL